jgi:spore germination protein KC
LASALLLTVAIALFVPGCWDRREPEVLLFPLLLGFDINESGQYEVLAQFPNPSVGAGTASPGGGSGGQALPFWLNLAAGETPFDALRNLALTSSRDVTLTHVGVILISERLARRGIGPVLELLLRNHELRLTARTAIVEGDIKALLESELPLEPTPGMGIQRMLEYTRTARSQVPEGNLLEKIREFSHPGHDPLFMRITVMPTALGQTYVDPSSTEGEVAKPIARIHGSAAFRQDRMVGWMDDNETLGANWVLDTVVRAVSVVKAPENKGLVTVELRQTMSQVKPIIHGDTISIEVKIGAVGRVQDIVSETVGDVSLDFDQHETLQWLTQEVSEEVEKVILQALTRAKELGSDVFGFGHLIYRKHPRVWEEVVRDRWDEIFRTLDVDVQVEIIIRRPGLSTSAIIAR